MKFFSSDLHFEDAEILEIDNRPFKTTKQFGKYIIKLWNKQTKKDDTIFVIGDFFDCDSPQNETWKKSILFVRKFKARTILIMGNNENRIVQYFFDNNYKKFREYCISMGFQDVQPNLTLTIENENFYLTHKPKDHKENIINLFGHSHRAMGIWKSFGFNIGCDLNHFRLFSENDIKNLLKLKEKYWDKDENLRLI